MVLRIYFHDSHPKFWSGESIQDAKIGSQDRVSFVLRQCETDCERRWEGKCVYVDKLMKRDKTCCVASCSFLAFGQ